MLLSDTEIASRRTLVTPFREDLVQPASIDLRLDEKILIPIDKTVKQPIELPGLGMSIESEVSVPIDPFNLDVEYYEDYLYESYPLRSGGFILASTYESVMMPYDLVGRVEGKSSLARLGLFVHVTAGFIDPGFEGNITLEIYNVNPRSILLSSFMKICQVCFEQLSSPAAKPYGSPGLGSHYQGQKDVTESRYGQ